MKLLVDEMPYWFGDCPFYRGGGCTLRYGEHCEHFDAPCGDRNQEECLGLITLAAHLKGVDNNG